MRIIASSHEEHRRRGCTTATLPRRTRRTGETLYVVRLSIFKHAPYHVTSLQVNSITSITRADTRAHNCDQATNASTRDRADSSQIKAGLNKSSLYRLVSVFERRRRRCGISIFVTNKQHGVCVVAATMLLCLFAGHTAGSLHSLFVHSVGWLLERASVTRRRRQMLSCWHCSEAVNTPPAATDVHSQQTACTSTAKRHRPRQHHAQSKYPSANTKVRCRLLR